ncbi:hypothetical protein EVAR_64885_1 [Eumeta japonica]|uniref:Uncharacterized protein n=1 Tax=Eumeta variegata TaxID=151549 RepID=A0A4C1ZWF9_EUMVA|nr:hypothetical protein EVAR_64885_1 [Eumeta japonica]
MSWSKGKRAPQTIAKPGLTRNKLMLYMAGLMFNNYELLRLLPVGKNHKYGSLLPIVDETQARCREKTLRIVQRKGTELQIKSPILTLAVFSCFYGIFKEKRNMRSTREKVTIAIPWRRRITGALSFKD